MSERLTSFLVSLATDPDRLQRFAADAGAEMEAAGLAPAERAALLSQDTATVRRALGLGPADHMTQTNHRAKARTRVKGGKKRAATAKKPAGKKPAAKGRKQR